MEEEEEEQQQQQRIGSIGEKEDVPIPTMHFARRKVKDYSQFHKANEEVACLFFDIGTDLAGSEPFERTNVVDVVLLSPFDLLCGGLNVKLSNDPSNVLRFLKHGSLLRNAYSRDGSAFFYDLSQSLDAFESLTPEFLKERLIQIRPKEYNKTGNTNVAAAPPPPSCVKMAPSGTERDVCFYFPLIWNLEQEEDAQRVKRLEGKKIRRSFYFWGDPKHRSFLVEEANPWAFTERGGQVLQKASPPSEAGIVSLVENLIPPPELNLKTDDDDDDDKRDNIEERDLHKSYKGEFKYMFQQADLRKKEDKTNWVPGLRGPILSCKDSYLVDRIPFVELTACAINSVGLKYIQKYRSVCKSLLVKEYRNDAAVFLEVLARRNANVASCKSYAPSVSSFDPFVDTDEDPAFESSLEFVALMAKQCKNIQDWDGEVVEYDDHAQCLGIKTLLFVDYVNNPVVNQTCCKRLAYALGLLRPPDVAALKLDKGGCETEEGELYSEMAISAKLLRLLGRIKCDKSDHHRLGDDAKRNGHCLSCAIKDTCNNSKPKDQVPFDFAREWNYRVGPKMPSSPLKKAQKAYTASHICVYNNARILNNLAAWDLFLKHLLKCCAFIRFKKLTEDHFLSRDDIAISAHFQRDPFARF